MSWSLSLLGTRDKVKAAVAEYSGKLTGQTKQEFDEAMPHLQGLLEQIVCEASPPLVKLTGNGSASFKDGRKTDGNLPVTIERLHTQLCI